MATRGENITELQPVPSGRAYRVVSPPRCALARPELIAELRHALERFAVEAGFDERQQVSLSFRPGIFGHHALGRAVDIYGVGGVGIAEWKRRWDAARACATGRLARAPNDLETRADHQSRLAALPGAATPRPLGATLQLPRATLRAVDARVRAVARHQRPALARPRRSHPRGEVAKEWFEN
jgi:hypothetical protein